MRSEPVKATVQVQRRYDGGWRVSSRAVIGLHLSGPDPEVIKTALPVCMVWLLEAKLNSGRYIFFPWKPDSDFVK